MSRVLEIVYKDITHSKITIARNRVTIKFPLRMQGKVLINILNRVYNDCCAVNPDSNTIRGKFKDDATVCCMWYDNGVNAQTTIYVKGIFNED
jgi:hypothetical protein